MGVKSTTQKHSYPGAAEIEVSLFGSGFGYGESILVHLGNDNWMVVDSCKNPNTKEPLVLEYLKNISPNLSRKIKYIVATHWHDDHIGGIAQILDESLEGKFCVSSALHSDEFFTLIQYDDKIKSVNSGVVEFNKIAAIATERKITIKQLKEDHLIHNDNVGKNNISVFALSPSDASISYSQKEIISLLSEYKNSNKVISKTKPNDNSIVILININSDSILLGADLENRNDKVTGWEAVFKTQSIKGKKAKIFKIPHHGSETSYNSDLHSSFIENDHISMLTPFNRGRKKLPTKNDIEKILSHTAKSFITSSTHGLKIKKRNIKVNKILNDFDFLVKEYPFEYGHIRIRKDFSVKNSDWKIDLFGNAICLKEILAEYK